MTFPYVDKYCLIPRLSLGTAIVVINPCPAELFQLYFSSFEAGIANAISSYK